MRGKIRPFDIERERENESMSLSIWWSLSWWKSQCLHSVSWNCSPHWIQINIHLVYVFCFHEVQYIYRKYVSVTSFSSQPIRKMIVGKKGKNARSIPYHSFSVNKWKFYIYLKPNFLVNISIFIQYSESKSSFFRLCIFDWHIKQTDTCIVTSECPQLNLNSAHKMDILFIQSAFKLKINNFKQPKTTSIKWKFR